METAADPFLRAEAEGRPALLGTRRHVGAQTCAAHGAVDTNIPVYAERVAAVKLSRGVAS